MAEPFAKTPDKIKPRLFAAIQTIQDRSTGRRDHALLVRPELKSTPAISDNHPSTSAARSLNFFMSSCVSLWLENKPRAARVFASHEKHEEAQKSWGISASCPDSTAIVVATEETFIGTTMRLIARGKIQVTSVRPLDKLSLIAE